MTKGKNKKRKIKAICIVISVCLILSVPLSFDLSLRWSVLCMSPKSAFTMEYKVIRKEDGVTYCSIEKNAPTDATGTELYIWGVYSYGPFHYAKYEGQLL